MQDGWTVSPPGRDHWRAVNPDGQWRTVAMDRGSHDHSRTWWGGGASQPIVPAMTVHNSGDMAPVLGAILHRLSYAGKTLAQSQNNDLAARPSGRDEAGPGAGPSSTTQAGQT